MINWVFDLDLTLYELKGNEFSYNNIIKQPKLKENDRKIKRQKSNVLTEIYNIVWLVFIFLI